MCTYMNCLQCCILMQWYSFDQKVDAENGTCGQKLFRHKNIVNCLFKIVDGKVWYTLPVAKHVYKTLKLRYSRGWEGSNFQLWLYSKYERLRLNCLRAEFFMESKNTPSNCVGRLISNWSHRVVMITILKYDLNWNFVPTQSKIYFAGTHR